MESKSFKYSHLFFLLHFRIPSFLFISWNSSKPQPEMEQNWTQLVASLICGCLCLVSPLSLSVSVCVPLCINMIQFPEGGTHFLPSQTAFTYSYTSMANGTENNNMFESCEKDWLIQAFFDWLLLIDSVAVCFTAENDWNFHWSTFKQIVDSLDVMVRSSSISAINFYQLLWIPYF